MSEYINADKLKEKFEKEYRSKYYSDYLDGRNNTTDIAKILLAETLTVNLIEEKYGYQI